MLSDFQNQTMLSALYLQCIQNGWQFSLEVHVNDGSNNLWNFSCGFLTLGGKQSYSNRGQNKDMRLLFDKNFDNIAGWDPSLRMKEIIIN